MNIRRESLECFTVLSLFVGCFILFGVLETLRTVAVAAMRHNTAKSAFEDVAAEFRGEPLPSILKADPNYQPGA